MFPVNFLRHTSTYTLHLNGVKIQARVVERTRELKEDDVAELTSRLDTSFPIVGFDLKYTMQADSICPNSIVILVLYVRDYCLLVKFDSEFRFFRKFGVSTKTGVATCFDSLSSFLNDESICFLGWGKELFKNVNVIKYCEGSAFKTCVEVSTLAARVLRNESIIEGCVSLEELASKLGVPLSSAHSKKECKLGVNALVYTEDEVKYAIEDAFKCYTIGTQLMKSKSSEPALS